MLRCSERMEIKLDSPKQALPVLDRMGFRNYQVIDKNTIYIYERLNETSASFREKNALPSFSQHLQAPLHPIFFQYILDR